MPDDRQFSMVDSPSRFQPLAPLTGGSGGAFRITRGGSEAGAGLRCVVERLETLSRVFRLFGRWRDQAAGRSCTAIIITTPPASSKDHKLAARGPRQLHVLALA
jgi:hypothetical protein